MKKRTKIALWAAAGCIFVGGLLMGIGSAAGGRGQLKEINNNSMGVTFEGVSLNVSDVDGIVSEILDEDSVYRGEEETPGQEVLSGDFTRSFSAEGLRKLDITVGVHSVILVEGDGDEVTVQGENCDRIQCFVKDGELVLKDVGRKKAEVHADSRKITLTLPAGIRWEEAEVEAAMGSVEIGRLEAREAELAAGMGSIQAEHITATELNIEAEMGAVEVEDFAVSDMDISADMGSVELKGDLTGTLEAEASMGSIRLELEREKSYYDYRVETSMGSVTLDGESWSKLEKELVINNAGQGSMELDASMGSIEIFFK